MKTIYVSLLCATTLAACAHIPPDQVSIRDCYTTFQAELLLRDAQHIAKRVKPEELRYATLYEVCREADLRGDNNGSTTIKEASQLLRWLIQLENRRTKE